MKNKSVNPFGDKFRHEIFYDWHIDIRGGGPTGYLANLLYGLDLIENPDTFNIWFNCRKKEIGVPRRRNKIVTQTARILFKNRYIKQLYVDGLSSRYKNYINFLNNQNGMRIPEQSFQMMDFSHIKSIHVHQAIDVIKVKNSLRSIGRLDIPVILTSHTPELPSNEYYSLLLEEGYSSRHAKALKNGWKSIEQTAFEMADIYIFPSPESMEPLLTQFENFAKIVNQKGLYFCETGVKELKPQLSREEARKKFGVEGKFVVGYVGRHNKIKGYNILQESAKSILSKSKDIVFLIGGNLGTDINPLRNKNWIEAGWIIPDELFSAIDVFVLPNTMTYYDLILLEAMSMGIPIIASATGGNKSVQMKTNSLSLYENNSHGLTETIFRIKEKNVAEIESIRANTRSAYLNFFKPQDFAHRYINVIKNIYSDYKII